jgi:hypothetical protein
MDVQSQECFGVRNDARKIAFAVSVAIAGQFSLEAEPVVHDLDSDSCVDLEVRRGIGWQTGRFRPRFGCRI